MTGGRWAFVAGRLAALALLLAVPLGLGGCTDLAVGTFDAKMSQITDEQCSYAHVLVGESYCRSRTVASNDQPIYCFRNIGQVDCYTTADPYDINHSTRTREPPLVGAAPKTAQTAARATAAPVPRPVPRSMPVPRPAAFRPAADSFPAAPSPAGIDGSLPTSLLPPALRPAS